jgi:tetratricopeptide (TPR) repeat protein
MAVLALIVADNQHRRRHADSIAEIVDGLQTRTPREDIEKAKARLIYHTAFGSLDEALASARRVLEAERRSGNSAALLRALRWASIPQRLTNDIDGALSALSEAYHLASRLGLRAEMWNAVYYIEGVALDAENVDLALEWAPIVEDLANEAIVHALRASDYEYFRARIEYMRGDLERARVFLDQSRHLNNSLPPARGEQSVLALDVMLRVRGESSAIPHRILQRLRSLHLRTRDSGILDFETAAVVAGLLHANRGDEAQALYSHYMRHRRSRIATHSTLQSVHAQLNQRGVSV